VSHLTAAFADELIKVGGIGSWIARKSMGAVKGTAKTIAKHPGKAMVIGMTIPTLMAAGVGYDSGLHAGEQGHQLAAGPDETGQIRASDAAYTNYHQLFKHQATGEQVRSLSKNYRPEAFRRPSLSRKEK